MALDVTATNLRREIEAAVQYAQKITENADERDLEINGSDFMVGVTPDIESHENFGDEWLANVLPQLVYYNPRTTVSSDRPVVQAAIVESIKGGLNAWIKKAKLSETLIEVAENMATGIGVVLLTMGPMPGYEHADRKALVPECTVLKASWFFQDPQARSGRDWRFRGHYTIRDIDDLNSETGDQGLPKYNAEVLAKLTPDTGPDSIVGKNIVSGVDRVPRRSIVMYEIYVPETGLIYTLAWGQQGADADYLCPPRKAFVPPSGPYYMFGIRKARNSPYYLPPLAVTAGLVREINSHTDQAVRQADRAKQMTFVDASADKLRDAMINGKDGEVYGIPGAHESNIVKITTDGPSEETMMWVETRRKDLQKKGGISDPTSGQVTGATATEITEVQQGASVRLKFMQRQFRACVVNLLEGVVWYLCKSNNIVFWVPQEPNMTPQMPGGPPAMGQQPPMPGMDPMTGAPGMVQPPPQAVEPPSDTLFMGGPQEDDGDFDPSDLQLDIEPYSMEMRDERTQQAQAQAVFTLALQAAPLIPQAPYIKWGLLWDDTLKPFGIVDGRKYLDLAMLQQMSMTPFYGPGSPPGPAPGASPQEPAPNPRGFAPQMGGGLGGGGQISGPMQDHNPHNNLRQLQGA